MSSGERAGKPVLQAVDDGVRSDVRALLDAALHGALATLDPETGHPFVSRVGLATDADGAPLFLASALSEHSRFLEADPRASLLVGEPGRGDPLAHPRVTLLGRAERVVGDSARARVRERYLARHPKGKVYVDFPDMSFWRLALERASFNGGFGRDSRLARDDLRR